MKDYEVTIDGQISEAFSADSDKLAIAHATAWARDGDWDDAARQAGREISAHIVVHRIDAGEYVEIHAGDVVVMDAAAVDDLIRPACPGDLDHDWRSPHDVVGGLTENPGVWGHGAGLRVQEVCARCRCYRWTDTGHDGDGRTVTRVTYEHADERSIEWSADR